MMFAHEQQCRINRGKSEYFVLTLATVEQADNLGHGPDSTDRTVHCRVLSHTKRSYDVHLSVKRGVQCSCEDHQKAKQRYQCKHVCWLLLSVLSVCDVPDLGLADDPDRATVGLRPSRKKVASRPRIVLQEEPEGTGTESTDPPCNITIVLEGDDETAGADTEMAGADGDVVMTAEIATLNDLQRMSLSPRSLTQDGCKQVWADGSLSSDDMSALQRAVASKRVQDQVANSMTAPQLPQTAASATS